LTPKPEKSFSGSVVLADVDLRKALIEDPRLLKMACEKAHLSAFDCQNFKVLLDLAAVLDPYEKHVNDEPRDKRSASSSSSDYYDYISEMKQSKNPSTKNSIDRKVDLKDNKQKDCDALIK